MHRFIVIVALTWTACTTPSAVEGQIAAIDGRVLLVEKGEERLAAVGDVLRYGQAVLTDASSRASIALRGGHAVEMTENSVLALNQPKGPKASLGATLERGSARVTSPHTNVILEIGTPFGLTELGGTDTRADISHDTGLTVDVGTIVVHAIAGNTIAVSAGQQFTIAGIVIALEKPPAAKLQANAKTSKRDTKRRKRKRRLKAALSNTAAVADVVESKP